jgi:hypothetical protein
MMTYGVATEDAAAEDSVQSKDVQRSMVAPVAPVPGDAGTVMMAEAPASMMDPAGEASYRGILTVEGLPPELEPYAPEDGTTEFTLPAEEFESVVEQLTAREAAFTLERPEGGEDADFSLVIVLPAQG